MNKIILFLLLNTTLTFASATENQLRQIKMNPQLARQLFEAAETEWLEAYNENLVQWFEKIADGDTEELTPEKVEEIRHARVLAQRLRSLYYFLDQRHEPPEEFHNFVKKFGKLKDSLLADEKIKKKSKKVLKVIEHKSPTAQSDFIPTSATSFEAFTRDRLSNILALSQHEALVFDDHHTLRKQLRDFMAFMRLYRKFSPSPELKALFKKMQAVDASLGEEHDNLEVEIIKSDKKTKRQIEVTLIELSPSVQELAKELNRYWLRPIPTPTSNGTMCGAALRGKY